MNITKLTINPIFAQGKKVIITNPTPTEAKNLLSQKLSMNYKDGKVAKVFRKIPKNLKGLVNPQTKVVNEHKFCMDI